LYAYRKRKPNRKKDEKDKYVSFFTAYKISRYVSVTVLKKDSTGERIVVVAFSGTPNSIFLKYKILIYKRFII